MTIRQLFGGPPLAVLTKLAVLSVIVGVVLSALGWSPYDIFAGLRAFLAKIYDMGFEAVELGGRYFLLGAVIVFPIWVISRLVKAFGRSG